MTRLLQPIWCGTLIAAILWSFSNVTVARSFDSESEEMLYFWGTQLAEQLDSTGITDPKQLKTIWEGMKDKVDGKAPEFGDEYPSLLNNWLIAQHKQLIEIEKQASAAYVKRMSKKKGAVTTDSGLVFIKLVAGTGSIPNSSSRIKAHYTGTLRDGTIFDSSYDRGEPLTIRLTQAIQCWSEAIGMMKVGGKATLVCPADIAYGDQGNTRVPGGAALTFEIELLEIIDG